MNNLSSKVQVHQSPSTISKSGTCFHALILGMYALDLNLGRSNFNAANLPLILITLLILVLFVGRIANRAKQALARPTWILLALYTIYCVASALWSPLPSQSIIHPLLILSFALATLPFAGEDPSRAAKHLLIAGAILSIASLCAGALFPQQTFQEYSSTGRPELKGVFFHQQRLGMYMLACLGIAAIYYMRKDHLGRYAIGPRKLILICALASISAYAAYARSYTAFSALALFVVFSLAGQKRKFLFCFASVIVLAFMAAGGRDLAMDWIFDSDVDLTLTGRTVVWERTLEMTKEAPWIGHGFGSYISPRFDWIWGAYRPPHAHNTFIHAIFETGYIGLSILVLLIISIIRDGIVYMGRTRKPSYALFSAILTIMAGLTAVFFGGKFSFILCLTILFNTLEQFHSVSSACWNENNKICPLR